MSVSDDSKMKSIETKYQILYSVIKQIKIKSFEELISLIELKVKKPEIYELIEKYDKNGLKSDIKAEEIQKQLYEIIKSKSIDILQLIIGHDINAEELTDTEIQDKFRSKLDELSQEFTESQILTKSLEQKFEKYQKLFDEYLENITKYYNKYKIGFELSYDDMDCSLSMSKAQTLCIRNRLMETESVFQKYGNKETIERLREERKRLESEGMELKNELKTKQDLLSQYESLPKDMLKEYRRLKSDLECRQWAITELNQSSGSASNGSVLSD